MPCLETVMRQFAAHNDSKTAGTEHVLAAAVHEFPQQAQSSFGLPLFDQVANRIP